MVDNIDYFFQTLVKSYMYADIECMMEKGLNFSIAPLLASWTEIIGSVYKENIGSKGKSRENYNTFLKKMGYSEVIEEFNNKFGNEPYDIIRCGLIHQYIIKKKANIHSNLDDCKKGIYLKEDEIVICNRKYFEDFKKAIDNVISEINGDSEKRGRINNRLGGINLAQTSGEVVFSSGKEISL